MAARRANPEAAPVAWERPLAVPELTDGELHVWRCELAGVDDQLLVALSPDERARADGFPQAGRGVLWARGRAVLRALLGAYTAAPPASLRLEASPAGKLALEHGPAFSLAHSGSVALYALSAAGAVGVDVELPRGRQRPGLARRVFGAEQAERLLRLPPVQRERELLRLWVGHEARRKQLGAGLGGTVQARPWLAELPLGAEVLGAVALADAPTALRLWQWPPVGTGRA